MGTRGATHRTVDATSDNSSRLRPSAIPAASIESAKIDRVDAVESAADEDHDSFGDGDHVASDTRPVERQSRPALTQRVEQPGGKYDPAGMTASQQGDRDPGETSLRR